MVQWFKGKKQITDNRLLSLNFDAQSDLQQKSLNRLVRFKEDTAFKIIEDVIFSSYQLELLGVHRIKTSDANDLARHLGRVDALFSIMQMMTSVKHATLPKEGNVHNLTEKKKARSSSRPII